MLVVICNLSPQQKPNEAAQSDTIHTKQCEGSARNYSNFFKGLTMQYTKFSCNAKSWCIHGKILVWYHHLMKVHFVHLHGYLNASCIQMILSSLLHSTLCKPNLLALTANKHVYLEFCDALFHLRARSHTGKFSSDKKISFVLNLLVAYRSS